MGKKKDRKRADSAATAELESEIKKLRKENKDLRTRLQKISRLASGLTASSEPTMLDLREEAADAALEDQNSGEESLVISTR